MDLCSKYNLGMNLGSFSAQSMFHKYDKLVAIDTYIDDVYRTYSFEGYGLLLKSALDSSTSWKFNDALSIMYDYVSLECAEQQGHTIRRGIEAEPRERQYNIDNIYALAGYLGNKLQVSTHDITEVLNDAIAGGLL